MTPQSLCDTQADGRHITRDNVRPLIVGPDTPGSVVDLLVRKSLTGTRVHVPLKRALAAALVYPPSPASPRLSPQAKRSDSFNGHGRPSLLAAPLDLPAANAASQLSSMAQGALLQLSGGGLGMGDRSPASRSLSHSRGNGGPRVSVSGRAPSQRRLQVFGHAY